MSTRCSVRRCVCSLLRDVSKISPRCCKAHPRQSSANPAIKPKPLLGPNHAEPKLSRKSQVLKPLNRQSLPSTSIPHQARNAKPTYLNKEPFTAISRRVLRLSPYAEGFSFLGGSGFSSQHGDECLVSGERIEGSVERSSLGFRVRGRAVRCDTSNMLGV